METKHIKGEWHVINVYTKQHNHWSGMIIIHDDDLGDRYGAEITAQEIEMVFVSSHITQELAKLIAAAPEILKALQRINTQLDNWKDNGSVDMIGIQSMMKISEHAIQKAKD